jgi:hypothetical protein
MIQRIQSLYLFIAAMLTGSFIWLKLATLANDTSTHTLTFKGIMQSSTTMGEPSQLLYNSWPLALLVIITTVVSLIALFLYKKRMLQIRIVGMNAALQLGLFAMVFYLGQTSASNLEAVISYHLPVAFPLVAVVLSILAIIAIGKDEALLRSFNRLR